VKLIYAIVLIAIALPAAAHGPTPRKTDQSLLIKAPTAVVWEKLSQLCAIADWHAAVSKCESVSATKRVLTLKNGGKISEEMDEILPLKQSIAYRLGRDSEAQGLAVSSLTGKIKLQAEGDATRVSWMARYYRADTTNEPAVGADDAAAQAAVDSYIKAALDGLEADVMKK
jgi:mxaD protein